MQRSLLSSCKLVNRERCLCERERLVERVRRLIATGGCCRRCRFLVEQLHIRRDDLHRLSFDTGAVSGGALREPPLHGDLRALLHQSIDRLGKVAETDDIQPEGCFLFFVASGTSLARVLIDSE